MLCTVSSAACREVPPRASAPASTRLRAHVRRLFVINTSRQSQPSIGWHSSAAASLLDALLDELVSIHHAETLRLGLLAAALALVDPQLDLINQAQADRADLR